jgi:hypothetical protein
MLLTRDAYGQSAAWQQAYDRLFLALPLAGLAALVPARLPRRGRAWAFVLAAALCAWGAWGLPLVRARTTDALEYAWLRPWFARLPAGCRVAYLASAGHRLVYLPWYLAPGHAASAVAGLAAEGRDERGLPAGACVFYVHTSLCTSAEGRAVCEALEHGLRALVPVARTTLPAAPSYGRLPYDHPTVDVVISRVQ